MEIKRNFEPEMTLQEFADVHGLTMEVNERSYPDLPRFHARFEGVEIAVNGFLLGEFGDGETEEEAIEHYRKVIQNKLLVYRSEKRVQVPRLKPYKP